VQRTEDGEFVFINNGGFDFVAIWPEDQQRVVAAPPFQPARPGIGLVQADGRVLDITVDDANNSG